MAELIDSLKRGVIMSTCVAEQTGLRNLGIRRPDITACSFSVAIFLAAVAWMVAQAGWEGSRNDTHSNRFAADRAGARTLFEDCQIRMRPTDSRCD